MRNNVIAFAGTHGIGKSRLALELANRLKKDKPFCIDNILADLVADLPGVNILTPDLSLAFEVALDLIMERLG